MNASFSITRALLLFALAGALIVAAVALRAQQQSAEGLDRASKEGLFWSAVQVEVELARFTATLGQFALGKSSASAERVNERFDILWSRVLLFREGEVGRRLMELDGNGAVDRLFAVMQRHEEAIVTIARQDNAMARRILSDFIVFGDDLRALSIRVIRAEENRLADVRANVRSSSYLTLVATVSVLVLVVTLAMLLLYETRRYKAQAEESARLLERAEAASRVKSRFLTMMSHELRTPMNGVMGMLALVRQTQLTEAQGRLVEQAQRSGAHMVMVLGDMLDLSDLQSEKQSVAREIFALGDLCEEISRQLAPRVDRTGLRFGCAIAPDAPGRIVGDFARIRQALLHLCTHLIDVVGSPEIATRIGHDGASLVIDVDAAVPAGESAGWLPEDMLEPREDGYGSFASESLSPMIAQGLLGLMGGRVEIRRTGAGRASALVSIPAERLPEQSRLVRIDVQSPTLAAVLSALVRAEGWRMQGAGRDVSLPDAVIFSADGRDEAKAVGHLRRDYPGVRILAVGPPQFPELFDAICTLPVTRSGLFAALDTGRPALRALS